MKTIGIIGGFSPEATAKFYLTLIRLARLEGILTQPHIIVWNVPVPKRVEENLLLRGEGTQKIKATLVHAAQELENAGADIIVLPCNTLHILAKDIQNAIAVPFLNIIETSFALLKRSNIKRAGVLGSEITVSSGLLEHNGIICTKPSPRLQQRLNTALHRAVVGNHHGDLTRILDLCVRDFSQQGIRDVILACTDFSGICTTTNGVRLHDTLTMLAKEVIKKIRS